MASVPTSTPTQLPAPLLGNEGVPAANPSAFTRGAAITADVLAAALLSTALVMWLADLPRVARGRLVYREEVRRK